MREDERPTRAPKRLGVKTAQMRLRPLSDNALYRELELLVRELIAVEEELRRRRLAQAAQSRYI